MIVNRPIVGFVCLVFFVSPMHADPLYEFVRKIENPAGLVDGSGDQFGISLAQVGNNLVVGAYRDDTGAENAGAAYLFDREGNLLTTIHNPTPEQDDWFGFEVRSVEDKILIAAENDSTTGADTGSVYLYDQQGNLLNTITNPTPRFDDDFGQRILGIGDRIVVTAWKDDTTNTNAGAAYLFDQDGTLLQEFFSPNPGGYFFGRSVTNVGDDKVLISAYREPLNDLTDVGAAYLFDLDGNLLQTFPNPDPADNDFFGIGVAGLGDNRIAISAIEHSPSSDRGGKAYVFDIEGNVEATVYNPDPANQDWFGRTMVAVGEDRFLIGATFDDTLGHDAGAAYLYNSSGELLQTFLPPEPVADGHFSMDISTLDDLILIGSDFADGGFAGPGAVYVYAPIEPFPGDFNADLTVDQGDLDLVLLHWGDDATTPPDGWTTDLPTGLVDQDELDKVLLNWGATQGNAASARGIPEPSTSCLLAVAVVALAGWSKSRQSGAIFT